LIERNKGVLNATEVSVLSNTELAAVLAMLMVFALLTLLLGRKNNRPMNIIAGTVFGIGELAMFVDGIVGYPSAPLNPMTGAAVALMVAVIRLVVKMAEAAGINAEGHGAVQGCI